jgi:hypothetical protein
MGNLVASAIYSIITIVVTVVFVKKPKAPNNNSDIDFGKTQGMVNVSNNNAINTTVQINRYYIKNETKNVSTKKPTSGDEDTIWLYLFGGIFIFALLTFLFSTYKSQIIQIGYITFGFGIVLSTSIFVSVIKQIPFNKLNTDNKISVVFPLIYWFLLLIITFSISHPLRTGVITAFIENDMVKNGLHGLIPRFMDFFTKDSTSCAYIIFRAIGVVLIILSLFLNLWFIAFFTFKWIIHIKKQGIVKGISGWFYRKLFIHKVLMLPHSVQQ